MKKFALFGVLALAVLAVAQDKVSFANIIKPGDALKTKIDLTMSVQGLEAKLVGTVTHNIQASGDRGIFKSDWSDTKVSVDGNEMDVPAGELNVEVGSNGQLLKAEGGIEGTDPVRTTLLWLVVLPTDPIAPGDKFTFEFPASGSVPATKYEGTFVGNETVAGVATRKLKINVAEVKGSFKTEMTVWITEAGAPHRLESRFTGLPIPQAGADANGTLILDFVK